MTLMRTIKRYGQGMLTSAVRLQRVYRGYLVVIIICIEINGE